MESVPVYPEPLTRDDAVTRRVEIRTLGAVGRNEAGPDSDVDVLMLFRPGSKSYERYLELCDVLEDRLGRRVDLVTTEALSPFLGPRILADAQDVLRAA